MSRGLTVAIDGPAGAGKSTVSKAVADALDYRLVDTGAIYRSVALLAQRRNVSLDDDVALAEIVDKLEIDFAMADGVNRVTVFGEDVTDLIRTPDISRAASDVSTRPVVRRGLLELQRRLAGSGGAVLEGRDIGTMVCPEAPLKFFLDADPEERARRRFEELKTRGKDTTLEHVMNEMNARDAQDQGREHAPLKVADDAVVLDSTALSPTEVVKRIVEAVRQAGG
ncbi:MAG: (d)CMP kinase [Clostridia bacterium]|nr:(d)CMP kinase [Deltaproteobacteria bacterium]